MSPSLQLKKVLDKIKKGIFKNVAPKQMQAIGEFVVAQIKARSRAGYGVEKLGGNSERFPKLSPEYVKQRRRSRLSPFTSPGKSNITRTGKLLASLRYTVKTGSVLVSPTGSRNDSRLSNIRLAEILQNDLNRPFMSLSKNQLAELSKFIKDKFSVLK